MDVAIDAIAPLKKKAFSNSQRDCDELSLVARAAWGAVFRCSAGGAFAVLQVNQPYTLGSRTQFLSKSGQQILQENPLKFS